MDLSAEDLALLDPFLDIVALFVHYNSLYFDGSLHTTSVQWSSERMTRQAQIAKRLYFILARLQEKHLHSQMAVHALQVCWHMQLWQWRASHQALSAFDEVQNCGRLEGKSDSCHSSILHCIDIKCKP